MICVVGLTPTVQRTLTFSGFRVGEVNRAKRVTVTASGKAVNVARVSARLGAEVQLVQILGGDAGRFVERELERENVSPRTVWHEDDAPTRTCTTILTDNAGTTELVEEARPVGEHDLRLLYSAAQNALLECDALCCSGSLPLGVPDDFYARLIKEARTLGVPVVVDAQKKPLAAALAERPFLVKPNREEAATTLGLTLSGDAEADAKTAGIALVEAGATWALISMGRDGSLLTDGKAFWRIVPPKVQAINPIGSGDSLAAGLAVGHFVRGLSVPEAVALGTACAAANCLTETSGDVSPADVKRLQSSVDVVLQEG